MSEAIEIAKLYLRVSNNSDMKAIANLMTPNTTYSSVKEGVFLGVGQIIEMQSAFHSSFEYLNWEIKEIEEIRPGVIYIDFLMSAKKTNNEVMEISGDEYVIVKDGKLQHVEVRNKPL